MKLKCNKERRYRADLQRSRLPLARLLSYLCFLVCLPPRVKRDHELEQSRMHLRICFACCTAAFASAVIAASSTTTAISPVISVFFLELAGPGLHGSIVHSDASRTTVAITRASESDLRYPATMTVTMGESTFAGSFVYPSFTESAGCTIYGISESASCALTLTGPAYALGEISVLTGSSITTRVIDEVLTGSGMSHYPVTITAADVEASSATTRAIASTSRTQCAVMTSSSGEADLLAVGLAGGAVGLVGVLLAVL